MQNREGVQKGPQDHAEGQHGSKTRSKILEQLHSGTGASTENTQNGDGSPKNPGHHNTVHRLTDARKQHDAAEKRSEKTRLHRAQERHRLTPDKPPKPSP